MKAVYGYTFFTGASTLLNVKESRSSKRRYVLTAPVRFCVDFDDGSLEVVTHPGFIFDGRSGPRIADIYAPNLGSLDERAAWLMHDALGYAGSLGFKETNIALKLFLRDICGYRKTKAEAIRIAVSLSRSWYGRPKPTDWCYANIGLVETTWKAR